MNSRLLIVAFGCAVLTLSGCVSNQAKISVLQAPEIEDATRFKTISVARFSGQQGELLATELGTALINVRVQDKPVYRSVNRLATTSAAMPAGATSDTRSLAVTARTQGADALVAGDVLQAGFQDRSRTTTEYVCDQYEKSKKLFKKCLSGHNATVMCTDRTASMQVQVKLVDTTSVNTVYNEVLTRQSKSEACGQDKPLDAQIMLAGLRGQIIEDLKRKLVPHDKIMDVSLMPADGTLRADTARERFDGAIKFAHASRMDRACEIFRDLFDTEKQSVALLYNLAVCEEVDGAYWKANEYLRMADRLTSEPNKLIGEALARNETSIKKAGALARNRGDLVNSSKLEAGAAPQTLGARPGAGVNLAQIVAPTAPNVTADSLLLEKRVALVIGNGAYRRGALLNPVNDARVIAAELRKANFQVIVVENADRLKMLNAIDAFGNAIKKDGVALVFYAGHGMQVKGENYLIPVDADPKGENDVTFMTINLGQVLSKLEDAKSRVNIVVLDACRDNPFARSWRSTRGGLASIDAPSGTVIAYATAPGKTAADGAGANGLYTSYFVKQLAIPNQKLEDVLKNTRKGVAAASNNQQIPWDSSSLTGDFYFRVSSGG